MTENEKKKQIRMMDIPKDADLTEYISLEEENEKLLKIIERLKGFIQELTEDGVSLCDSSFIEEAKTYIQALDLLVLKTQKIELSERDYNKFIEALENPPKPNAALKKLIQENNKLNETD